MKYLKGQENSSKQNIQESTSVFRVLNPPQLVNLYKRRCAPILAFDT
ncbi:MAG: hypothetical protein ABF643_06255 [Oenococcus oeni]